MKQYEELGKSFTKFTNNRSFGLGAGPA